jgi:predicted PurR-regulated permease PerM
MLLQGMNHNLSRIDALTFVLIAGILIAAVIAFWPLLDVFVLAMSVAVVALPLQRKLRSKMKDEIAAFLTTTTVFILIFLTLLFGADILYQNSDYLTEIVSMIINWVRSASYSTYLPVVIPPEQIAEWLKSLVTFITSYLAGLAKGIPLLIVKIILFFLSLAMFVYRGEAIWSEFLEHIPQRISEAMEKMTGVAVNTLYSIYIVHIATSIITFVLALPFFYVLGYGHIIFFSLMAGIFQLIPIIGPSFLMIILAVYSFSLGDLRGMGLVVVIGYPVVCAFPDIYLRPLLMGKRATMNPILMWIGFFGGLAVMGLVGFVLGPLFIALAVSGYRIVIDELKLAKQEEIYD